MKLYCLIKAIQQGFMFGSYAHGNPRDDSDIDLLAILDKEGKSDSYK